MTSDTPFHAFALVFQVFLLDLVLSGDNALVIALACRSLPARQVNQAMMIGTGAAIALRVLLATVVSSLLSLPVLKLIGAVWLIAIAIKLMVEEERDVQAAADDVPARLWGAVMTVLAADLVMSLDNVVALAAVSQGRTLYLVLGLLLSVPLLMFGSKLMTHLLQHYPLLVPAGGALLGYVAGEIAVSDPAIAHAVLTQSPALTVLVPILCAVFVVAESRIIERRRAQLPRPAKPRAKAAAAPVPAPAPTPVTPAPAPAAPTPAPAPIEAAVSTEAAPAPVSGRKTSFGPLAIHIAGLFLLVLIYGIWSMRPELENDHAADRGVGGASSPNGGGQGSAYRCPGSGITIYYRHDSNSISMVTADSELTGYVDYRNKISWDNLQAVAGKLHFIPPDHIEDMAKIVTINGGSFADIQCVKQ